MTFDLPYNKFPYLLNVWNVLPIESIMLV